MTKDDKALRDLTPYQNRCIAGIGCPAIYETIERNTSGNTTNIGGCFAGLGCPAIYSTTEDTKHYILIGRQLDQQEINRLGLEGKIGPREVVIEVPKEIIDKKLK